VVRNSGKLGPRQNLSARGVLEPGRTPEHPRLAEILLRYDNTNVYLDSTRHAKRCVSLSVTQGL
jgi:hypothetical protein